ncbi:hypothetical protein ACIGB8_17630 [Promicromonospora sukumoe]|uniref:hypothetical protein n=1 Tax=Promicromonospora sukumoe TaxID=88382 RepID=UPI0037C6238A
MSHPDYVAVAYGEPRVPGGRRPDLYIGPSRFGTLEVLATITPSDGVHIFHAMPLRETTRLTTGARLTTGTNPTTTGYEDEEPPNHDENT